MHILYITSEFIIDKNKGGLANFTANIAEIFAANNHIITVLVISNCNKEILWKKKIKLIYFDPIKSNAFLNILEYLVCDRKEHHFFYQNLFYSVRGQVIKKKILKIHKENEIDIVHFANIQCLAYKVNINIPSVIRISSFPGLHRHAQNDIDFSISKSIKEMNISDEFELQSIKKSACIITPSEFTQKLIFKTIEKEATVIESPFYFSNSDQNDDLYKKEFADKKYFLYYGRLSYLKGTHTLAQAAYNLLDKYQDNYLVLIGNDSKMKLKSGKMISAYRYVKTNARQYADRVIYKDFLPKEKLIPIIKGAELCLFPSRVDNLPNTAIEAMGLGKAVIGTKGASFEQIIEDGKSGFLCKRESVDSLLSCIDRYMSLTYTEKKKISDNAKKRITEMEPDKIYREYFNIYREQIRNQKRQVKKKQSALSDKRIIQVIGESEYLLNS